VIPRFVLKSETKSMYNRWSHFYGSLDMAEYISTLDYDDVTLALNRAIEGMPRDARVLDLGCGPGRHLIHLGKLGFHSLCGLDYSNIGLKHLKTFDPSIAVVTGDASIIPFASNSFDFVVMVGVVYEIEDASRHSLVFEEIFRILKPGGALFFVNNSPNNFGERLYTLLTKRNANKPSAEETFFIWRMSREAARTLIRNAGFTDICEHPCNQNRGIMRFHFGIFVNQNAYRSRIEKIKKGVNTYSLHEYYVVNKNTKILTYLGRFFLALSKVFAPFLFANTIIYTAKKNSL
jgi:SAM-dependent methyltransferase